MELTAYKRGKRIDTDKRTLFVINKVKEIVFRHDINASLVLFGSHARGDWHEESDWDFLALTEKEDTEAISDIIRKEILEEIELVSFDSVFVLVKNRKQWEEDYWVTTLYKSIEEEGLNI